MTNECIPAYRPGADLTARADAGGLTGKTFARLVGGIDPVTGTIATVARSLAQGDSVGVVSRDAAAGALVHILRGPGQVVPVTAGGTIAVGAEVEVGASGRAVTIASGKARGRAWSSGTAGNDVFIELY